MARQLCTWVRGCSSMRLTSHSFVAYNIKRLSNSESFALTFCTDIPAPTIYQLTEELLEVDEWYLLGVVLKVPVSKLKEIQGSSPQAGIRFWRIDVLYHWLQSTPHASWNDIVLALKKIGQHTLSARLQEKYITPYTAGTGMSCSILML